MKPIREELSAQVLPQSDPMGSYGGRAQLRWRPGFFYSESGIDWGFCPCVYVYVCVCKGMVYNLPSAVRLPGGFCLCRKFSGRGYSCEPLAANTVFGGTGMWTKWRAAGPGVPAVSFAKIKLKYHHLCDLLGQSFKNYCFLLLQKQN